MDDNDLPRLLARDVALVGGLAEDQERWINEGEVFNRRAGGLAGAGRGLRNLSIGSMVRNSELVELMLAFRERLVLLRAKGTFKTLTS